MFYAIIFVLGVAVGAGVTAAVTYKRPSGTLKMDYSTGDPYLFLELHVPMEELLQQDTASLKVDHTRT